MVADFKIGQAASAYGKMSQMPVETGADSAGKAGFGDMLGDVIKGAINDAKTNESITTQAVAGKKGVTDLVMAINNTELTLQTVVAVRDKVIGAYQDIIKMPI